MIKKMAKAEGKVQTIKIIIATTAAAPQKLKNSFIFVRFC